MKQIPLHVLTMALVSLVVSPAVRAATFQHNTVFDASFDATLTGPFVGTGTLTYDAATALPNGSYDLASFTALTLFLDFPTMPTGFNLGDLTTTPAQVNIVLLGSGFYFTNDSLGGSGDGSFGGTADFINGAGYQLSTEPYEAGAPGPSGSVGGATTPGYLLVQPGDEIALQGTYGVVPEPSAAMLLVVAGGLCFRRRRTT